MAGPKALQDVGRLDLKPARFLSHKRIGGVSPEEAVLFVVKPDEAELVFGIDLVIAAEGGVSLVVDVHHRNTGLIGYGVYFVAHVVSAVGARKPPLGPREG